MRNELEENFGRTLLVQIAHLIKNAKQIPEPVLQTAREVEAFTWAGQDQATKRERVKAIAEQTEPPSEISRHMEAYPHAFSKKKYGEYLLALKLYKKSLEA